MSETILDTGLFGNRAKDIIKNSITWFYYDLPRKIYTFKKHTNIEVTPTGSLLIHYSNNSWRGYTSNVIRSSVLKEQKSALADIIKNDVKHAINNSNFKDEDDKTIAWKRNSNFVILLNDLKCTISECYCLYELLKGRKIDRRYNADIISKFLGEELDPITSEVNRVVVESTKEIYNKFYNNVKKTSFEYGSPLYDEFTNEVSKLREIYKDRCSKERYEVYKNFIAEFTKNGTDLCNDASGLVNMVISNNVKLGESVKQFYDNAISFINDYENSHNIA